MGAGEKLCSVFFEMLSIPCCQSKKITVICQENCLWFKDLQNSIFFFEIEISFSEDNIFNCNYSIDNFLNRPDDHEDRLVVQTNSFPFPL